MNEFESLNDNIKIKIYPPTIIEETGIYFGQWTLDKAYRHGIGIMYYDNDQKYIGQWANDKPNGKGKFFQGDSNYYEGSFLDGQFNGH